MSERMRAAGYHGINKVKFAPKRKGVYATEFIKLEYAQSLGLNAKLEGTELYADNRLVCRVPSDTGYEGELGMTTSAPELEKAAGFALEGEAGLITTNVANYLRGALYYEHLETDEDGVNRLVKTWVLNTEIGKGSKTHSTDQASVQFGSYSYPFRSYGDPLMAADGTSEYLDENGVGRLAFFYSAWPDDPGYADFDKTVPVPKVAAETVSGGGDEQVEA